MRAAVFLDRDGVLNLPVVKDGKPYPPASVAELEIYDGAREALEQLRAKGYALIVVTNQPDVARGTALRETVEAIDEALVAALTLDDVLTCYHDDGQCSCRKPAPGLLLAGAERHSLDLGRSWLIGDRWRDIDAGAAAGVRSILIDRGYRERSPATRPFAVVETLQAAVDIILKEPR